MLISVDVPVAERSYRTLVGDGAIEALSDLIPQRAKRAAIVTQPGIDVQADPGIEHRVFEIPPGEAAKTLSTIGDLCSRFAQWGLTRGDVVVGVGGGVVTDVAGFTAASYHRGIPVVHVATTLLAQIDAAIGGKTGVNLPEGKNLVGAYWQPHGVICDTSVLATLPPREYRSGLGEMAKYHFLGGDDMASRTLPERVARCVEIKAEVVAADEREGGRRAILNYGHTLAHALEIAGSFDLRHGEAVAIGLQYAARLAHVLGRIDADRVQAHLDVMASYDVSCQLPDGVDIDELIELMGRDKKAIDGMTFVLDGDHGVEQVVGIERSTLVAAFEAMG